MFVIGKSVSGIKDLVKEKQLGVVIMCYRFFAYFLHQVKKVVNVLRT